ncbi:hypothetical protein JX265_008895 [Neoarthrinium moseri]|uniref:Ribosomal protein S17 n=1 Tax=Neoarthrinium moseri TaxID=1658444 RepID=A0A9P9WH56_9PEZI|nr:uncharacterized protein JN550_013203 [Neoarthrinium moseri]KAI1848324.1 hypothetical protein JX266_005630 [Neoarthrinium moseri]KAI1857385.1 hypothetical protein JN550_013203 [Neoarthrinium moseri]KAI1863678.1 hypothetical protein JX265_008895 [Neoarthrinium moseri]
MAAPASTAVKSLAANVLAHASNTGRQIMGSKTAVVVSAGKMDKTVKVRLWGQRWEKHVQKVQQNFQVPSYMLVHDPNNSVRQGDVINISSGWRAAQHVRHVVRHIIAPYGPPIDERPPVLSQEELLEKYAAKREAKLERRAARHAERHAIRDQEKALRAEKRARWEAAERERLERREKKLAEIESKVREGEVD